MLFIVIHLPIRDKTILFIIDYITLEATEDVGY